MRKYVYWLKYVAFCIYSSQYFVSVSCYTCDICLVLAAMVFPYISFVELLLLGSVLLLLWLDFVPWLCGTTLPIPSKAFIGGFGVTLGGIFFPNVCDCEVVSYIELFKYPSGE